MSAPAAYVARWPNYTIKFRLLTAREVEQALTSTLPQAARDAWVYRTAILEGPSLDRLPAGIMCWLGYFLIDQSPFNGNADLIQTHTKLARQVFASSWREHARALICGTFRYTFEDVDGWDQETFFARLAAAEFLTGGPKFEASNGKEEAKTPPETLNPYEQQAVWRKQQNQQKKEFLRKRTEARR